MTDTNKETFCNCFECDKPIFIGDSCHSITYSYDKIESSMMLCPTKAVALGTWCSNCFDKMVTKGICTLSLEDISP